MAISNDDLLFMRISDEVRQHSHDPHRQVGAVIVDSEGIVIATGSNHPPSVLEITADDSRAAILEDPSWKYFMLEHAERNAIYDAFRQYVNLTGTTMYTTLFPCADCARAIVAAGITRLVVPSRQKASERDAKWSEHYRFARQIFEAAGVQLDEVLFDVSVNLK